MVKTCTKCGETKALEGFSRLRRNPDGLLERCKECVKAQNADKRNRPIKVRLQTCYHCGKRATSSNFTTNWSTRNGKSRRCKTCDNEARREAHLVRKYGITLAERRELWITQKGECAICSRPIEEESRYTHVDHCHETNKVRALLCLGCNTGLGSFQENPTILQSAIEYLQKHKEGLDGVATG